MALIVNGERIDDDAIQQEAERMRPQYEQAFSDDEPEAREARLIEWARENCIERHLLAQEAARNPEPVPAKDIDTALEQMKDQYGGEDEFYKELGVSRDDEIRRDIERRLRIDRLIEKVAGGLPNPSDEQIQQYYEEHGEELMAPEQARVAHIVKHIGPDVDPAEAHAQLAQALAKLEQGAEFADLAEEYSDCPDNGGDLGHFARGQMVEEFEDRVFSMAVGQVSPVFPTRFGYHVAKLLDRKPAQPCPLEEAREHIHEEVAKQIRDQAIETFIDKLRAKATIEEA